MVKFRLHILMAERGPDRPFKISEIAKMSGLQANTVSGIYNNKARRIDTATLDTLCEVLKCQPGDLFDYSHDSTAHTGPNLDSSSQT